MGKANPAKTSFNAGEWSPRMQGRTDLDKYPNSCEILENMVPIRQGPVMSRPGLKWIANTADGSGNEKVEPSLLIPFVLDEDNAYILEFVYDGSANVDMYVYDQDGALDAGPVAVTAMTGANDLFDGQNRPKIKFAQNADEMYFTHADYAPHRIVTDGASTWTITQPTFSNGPYFDTNTTAVTMTPSGTSGSITMTASSATFVATDVGRLFRFFDSGSLWKYLTITGFTSTTQVTMTVLGTALASVTASDTWALGLWSDTTGYPTAVTFHDGRLAFNGPEDVPARVDLSVPFLYTNFRPSDTDGSVLANDAIAAILNTRTSNKVRWIESMDKGLAAGTGGGNFMIRPVANTSGLSPLNIESAQVTRISNSTVAPIMVDEVALFLQTAQRQLHELVYSFDLDSFQVPDITILADHIASERVVQMGYQRSPHSIVWCAMQNGDLIGMVYDRSQNVVGWFNAPLGGDTGVNMQIRSVAVIPDPTANNDQVWVCVKRNIDGNTNYYLEQLQEFWEDGDDIEDAVYVDSAITYSGVSTTTISGLDHLEGESVAILGDGGVQAAKTVASGSITLDTAVTKASVGLGYTQKVTTQKFEAGSSDGTAQGKKGKISSLVIRLWRSLGGRLKSGGDEWESIDYRKSDDLMDTTTGVFTGDYEMISMPAIHDRQSRVEFENPDPTPVTIIGMYPTLDKGGR